MCLVIALVMALTLIPRLPASMAYAAGADGPDHAKILQVNDDGTYTLAFTVKGEAERIPQKVNVIVILDRSGSMAFDSGDTETTYTRTTTNGNR